MNEWHFLQRNGDFTLPSNWKAFKIVYWYNSNYSTLMGVQEFENNLLNKSEPSSSLSVIYGVIGVYSYTRVRFDRDDKVSTLRYNLTEGTNCYDIYYKI